MNLLASKNNHGDITLKTSRQKRVKNVDNMLNHELARPTDNELHQNARVKQKTKKLKRIHKSDKYDKESSEAQSSKKKRKLIISANDDASNLSVSGRGLNDHSNTFLKNKKQHIEESTNFDPTNNVNSLDISKELQPNRKKHVEDHLIVEVSQERLEDSVTTDNYAMTKKKKKNEHPVLEEKSREIGETIRKNRKKKKMKLKNNILDCEETDCKEKYLEDTSSKVPSSLIKKEADSISRLVKEEPANDISPIKKKKKKHKSHFQVEEEINLQNIQKEKGHVSKSMEDNVKLQSNVGISLAEVSNNDENISNCCSTHNSKRKMKEREASLHREISEAESSCVLNSMHQENIVEELWKEIKRNIKMKISKGKAVKNELSSSEGKTQSGLDPKSETHIEEENDFYSVVFKFDNHPHVSNYFPKKLMALSQVEWTDGLEINLQIPRTCFKGSSLDALPGYGYGI